MSRAFFSYFYHFYFVLFYFYFTGPERRSRSSSHQFNFLIFLLQRARDVSRALFSSFFIILLSSRALVFFLIILFTSQGLRCILNAFSGLFFIIFYFYFYFTGPETRHVSWALVLIIFSHYPGPETSRAPFFSFFVISLILLYTTQGSRHISSPDFILFFSTLLLCHMLGGSILKP